MTILDDIHMPSSDGWPLILNLPSPGNPMAVARALIDQTKKTETIAWWRGDFYRWADTHWTVWPDEEVRSWLYKQTEIAMYDTPQRDGTTKAVNWAPTKKKITDLIDALGHGVVLREGHIPSDDGGGYVAFTNGVLHVAAGRLLDHTPSRFNLHAMAFGYNPDATCPRWVTFLSQALEDDPARTALLQEWFGYVICGGTELQKILSMFGPKRCGKGTVMRILTALLGPEYVAAPSTLDSLAGTFGQEKLIGTRLAVLGDVQWVGVHMGEVVGILLGISGEDFQTIHRKNRTDWKGRLGTRFMLAGNDRPKFNNASTALVGRMEQLQFRVSFYGREDAGLEARLLTELSGIFNWALEGWRRLKANGGRFTQSTLGQEAKEEIERIASPVTAFARDSCMFGVDFSVELDLLYKEYTRWRAMEHLEGAVPVATFSRNLQSSFAMVHSKRVGSARTGRTQIVYGIRLRTDDDEPFGTTQADQADQADQDRQLDLAIGETAGQSINGPGGPGGPGTSGDYPLENSTSPERTSGDSSEYPTVFDVRTAMGNPHGPSWSPPTGGTLTCGNSGPGNGDQGGPASGPGPAALFDPDLYYPGWDQEPPDPDDIDPDLPHGEMDAVTNRKDPES